MATEGKMEMGKKMKAGEGKRKRYGNGKGKAILKQTLSILNMGDSLARLRFTSESQHLSNLV
jgi:hypothetical protein